LPGVICRRTGPVSFVVKLVDGHERHCHQDQLQKRTVGMTAENPVDHESEIPVPPINAPDQNSTPVTAEPSTNMPNHSEVLEPVAATPEQSVPNPVPRKTYPTRSRTAVQRFELTW